MTLQHGEKVNKWLLEGKKFHAIKKEKEYEIRKACGIYAIFNIINGHCYVGQSFSIGERWKQHRQELSKGRHTNPYLQNAWNKYGSCSFEFVLIERSNPTELDDREQYWIERLKPEYNIIKNVFEFWTGKKEGPEARAAVEEEKYTKPGETFERPLWHSWVYGGGRNPLLDVGRRAKK